jgi:hypothetical protein
LPFKDELKTDAFASTKNPASPSTSSRNYASELIDVSGRRSGNMTTEGEVRAAEIGAAEARTDTKIVRLEGKLDLIAKDIVALAVQVSEQRRDRNLIIGTIVVAAIAVGALFVAMATYGDALFGRGMSVRDVVQTTVKETLEQSKKAP